MDIGTGSVPANPWIMGLLSFIVGKIVWDWLQKRKLPESQYCPLHDTHDQIINELKSEMVISRTRSVDRDEMKSMVVEFNRKVDGIDIKIDKITDDVNDIRIAMAAHGLSQKKT